MEIDSQQSFLAHNTPVGPFRRAISVAVEFVCSLPGEYQLGC
jgi:hypothetical protein